MAVLEPSYRGPIPQTHLLSQVLALRFCEAVHVGCAGPQQELDGQMPVFLNKIGDGIDVGRRHNCLWRTTSQFEFCWLVHLQRLYATAESLNHLMFPSQMPPLITQLFHSVFSLSTHKIWSCCVVPQTHPFFPNIQRHTVRRYTSVPRCTLAFFSFFTSTAVHICSYVLLRFMSRENQFFPPSGATIVCRTGTSTCFLVTSYISPLIQRIAVGMCSLVS